MTLRIHDIPIDNVTDFWPLAEPLLKRAIAHNPHHDAPGVLQLLMAGFAQLIVGIEDGEITVAAVMERQIFPKHVVGNIFLMAGRRGTMGARLDALSEHLARWARAHGCDRIGFTGLPGLTKVVKRHGGSSIKLIHAWRDL
jgi:hypothetical protein